LLGVGAVAWGLRKSRKLFKREPLLSKLRRTFTPPRIVTASLQDAVRVSAEVVGASLETVLPNDATVEQRLAALERRVDEAAAAIRQAEDRARQLVAEL